MSYQVLARKWRPQRFDDVVGQPHVVRALSNALNQQHLHHAYLFTGTRGVGKTSLARIIVKCFNCEQGISATPCNQCNTCQEINSGRFPDLFEVDAASRTKVEDTRELLENAQYSPSKGRFKTYLIDEVHRLSGHSFDALLKTLEEPPTHVKFLLATTDYQALPTTVLSRCLQFHLKQISPQQIAEQLKTILKQEDIAYDATATELIARAANGSMRDALSLLDQSIAYGNGKVLNNDVKIMLGSIESSTLFTILEALHTKDSNALLSQVAHLAEQGVDWVRTLNELLTLLHQIAILQVVPDIVIENDKERLLDLAQRLSPEDVQLFYQIGLLGQRDLSFAPTLQIGFEMTMLRMLAFYPETVETPINTAPPTQKTTTTKVNNSQEITSWNKLVPQLNLTGAALLLAQQCSLKEMAESHIRLALNPKQKPLLQQKQIQRIKDALNNYFNRTIAVTIDIGNDDEETPATIAKRQQQYRQNTAEEAIKRDQQVQRIMQTFDATIIKDSIIPNEGKR